MIIVCSVEFYFEKNACANFSTPYTAHPPTPSETIVTQRVGMKRKEFEKTLDSQIGKRKIRTPDTETHKRLVSQKAL